VFVDVTRTCIAHGVHAEHLLTRPFVQRERLDLCTYWPMTGAHTLPSKYAHPFYGARRHNEYTRTRHDSRRPNAVPSRHNRRKRGFQEHATS
jgi:hypothetical protein